MEPNMFCYQCQETAKGTGCILKGVCGKESHTAQAMDLLLFVVRGISVVADTLRKADSPVSEEVNIFVTDALFCTITNANFDDESILKRVDRGLALRNGLIQEAKHNKVFLPQVDELTWQGTRDDYAEKAKTVGVLREQNEDLRSLKELLVYGLKGMAAYLEHAMRLGFNDDTVHVFMQRALATIAVESLSAEEWVKLVLEAGEFGVKTMALLDAANTGTYGNPEITKVNIGVKNRPGILISGHDLKDMEELLRQTEGTGIDVYTHGEMLPAHYYPAFKKYSHFVGNYGNAWWKQREEFTSFNGPILFTTNCIVPPLANAVYKERMFITNSTGYPGCKYIDKDAEGRKDFSEIIEIAKQCQPPVEIEHGEIIGGFAHNQVLQLADKVVDAVKTGAIRRFIRPIASIPHLDKFSFFGQGIQDSACCCGRNIQKILNIRILYRTICAEKICDFFPAQFFLALHRGLFCGLLINRFLQGFFYDAQHELNKSCSFALCVRLIDCRIIFDLMVVDDGFYREPRK